ncbi:hypothetical protein NX059_010754 [Plenodomus lindquistii]|nr:hypothetical protein NX059_010754 [Plenodomus lindquistii]
MPPKTQTQSKPAAASGAKNAYLLTYNAVSAALWAGVLYHTITIAGHEISTARKAGAFFGGDTNSVVGVLSAVKQGLSSGRVYKELEMYTRLVQSGAGLEVLHSLVGLVRAPLLTTLMQVSSRFLLVWLIAYPFPASTQHNPAYTTMLLAWSFTEVVRYSYFVFTLSGVGVPKLWTWLRYNTFLVLYPLGVASECWLVYSAIPLASRVRKEYGIALWVILAIYVPGIYILFTHMLKQRRRVIRESRRA